MSELSSLQLLLEHEQRLRDQAQAQWRQAQSRLQQAQAQADQLGSYRGEYQQRWSTQFSHTGADTALLGCYQSFSERLHQAVDQQQHVRQIAHTQAEQARQALQAQELRVAAVSKLIERRLTQARLAAARQDQKRTDEAASRAASQGAWNHPGGGLG